ncbi:unnamed protein product [Gordionus sp. m RMFG-2023]|uniref:palmitoyltransferase ZDHHC20-like n=1 Tax=Gordionus sp. m RMFG-2023 TaxID=3053472 RepID=UPI0030E085E4
MYVGRPCCNKWLCGGGSTARQTLPFAPANINRLSTFPRASRIPCLSPDNLCLRAFKWIPVVFVCFILVWSYYAYVVQFCCYTLMTPQYSLPQNGDDPSYKSHDAKIGHGMEDNSESAALFNSSEPSSDQTANISDQVNTTPRAIAYLIVFHPLFLLLLWSYFSVTLTPACKGKRREGCAVPKVYALEPRELVEIEKARDENELSIILNQVALRVFDYPRTNNQIKPLKQCTLEGGPRYCDICKHLKPDRCHHCGACGECVLKMDHHCPWVNNCVNFGNQKQFVLLLIYGCLISLFAGITTFPYFVSFWSNSSAYQLPLPASDSTPLPSSSQFKYAIPASNYTDNLKTNASFSLTFANASLFSSLIDYPYTSNFVGRALLTTRFHVLFLFFVVIMFGIALSALLAYHCYLISLNRTTLDTFRAPVFPPQKASPNASIKDQNTPKPDLNGFNLGTCRANFEQVFGKNPYKWAFPIFTAIGDGTIFPNKYETVNELCQNLGSVPDFHSFNNDHFDSSGHHIDSAFNSHFPPSPRGNNENKKPGKYTTLFEKDTSLRANDGNNFVNVTIDSNTAHSYASPRKKFSKRIFGSHRRLPFVDNASSNKNFPLPPLNSPVNVSRVGLLSSSQNLLLESTGTSSYLPYGSINQSRFTKIDLNAS